VEALEEVKSSVTELKQKVDFDGVGTDLWKDIQKIQKKGKTQQTRHESGCCK